MSIPISKGREKGSGEATKERKEKKTSKAQTCGGAFLCKEGNDKRKVVELNQLVVAVDADNRPVLPNSHLAAL